MYTSLKVTMRPVEFNLKIEIHDTALFLLCFAGHRL